MIITIAGLSGSGKNSVGAIVAKRLGLRLIDPTFKTLAEERRMDLMEFHRKAEKEHSIDRDFDAQLIDATKAGNCVVSTWLGPWMILNADLRVWLSASQHSRAQRISGREGMAQEQALAHIAERDASNRTRYLDIYRIDIYDHSDFDLVVNTEKFRPEQSAEIIVQAAAEKMGKAAVFGRLESFASGKKAGKKKAPAKMKAAAKKAAKKKGKAQKTKRKK
jgi:CMP/dCMP kinase